MGDPPVVEPGRHPPDPREQGVVDAVRIEICERNPIAGRHDQDCIATGGHARRDDRLDRYARPLGEHRDEGLVFHLVQAPAEPRGLTPVPEGGPDGGQQLAVQASRP